MGADEAGTSTPMATQQQWRKTPISSNLNAGFGYQQMENGYPYNWPRIIYEDWNRFRSGTIRGAHGLKSIYTIHGKDVVLKDPHFSPDNCTADMVWSRHGTNQFVNGPVFYGVHLDMSMFEKFLTPKPRPTLVPYHPVLDQASSWENYFAYPAEDHFGSPVWFPASNVIVYTPPRAEAVVQLDPMLFSGLMMPSYQEQLVQMDGMYNWGLGYGFPSTSLLWPQPPPPPRPPSPFDLIDRIDQLHLAGTWKHRDWNAHAFPNSSHVTVASDSDSDYVPSAEASRRPSFDLPSSSRAPASPPVFNDPTSMVIDHFMGEPRVRTGHRDHRDHRKGFRPFHQNNSGSPKRRGRGFHHGSPRGPTPPRPASSRRTSSRPTSSRPTPSRPAPPRPSPPRQPVLVARPASNPQNPVRQAPGRPAPIRQFLPAPPQPVFHWLPQRPRPRRLEDMKLNEVLGLDGHIRHERREGARNRNRQPRDHRHHNDKSNANRGSQ